MKIGVIDSVRHKALIADRCPLCRRMAEQRLIFTQQVFVLGFPVFPLDKKASVRCDACSGEYPVASAPAFVATRYAELSPTIKTPIWAFSLLILMGGLIAFALIKSPFDQNKMGKFIDAPKVGDIYEVRNEKKSALFHTELYTEWKVVSHTADKISVVASIYEVDDIKDVSKMKERNSSMKWRDDTVSYSKDWLREHTGIFCDDPHITEIERPGAAE